MRLTFFCIFKINMNKSLKSTKINVESRYRFSVFQIFPQNKPFFCFSTHEYSDMFILIPLYNLNIVIVMHCIETLSLKNCQFQQLTQFLYIRI